MSAMDSCKRTETCEKTDTTHLTHQGMHYGLKHTTRKRCGTVKEVQPNKAAIIPALQTNACLPL
jgi:hypothetical protein